MTIKKIAYSIILLCCALFVLVFVKLMTDEVKPKRLQSNPVFQNIGNKDSIELSASTSYQADALQAFLQGNNYRQSWAVKVKVPILYLDTLYGGVSIVKEGGGMQTKSLRLKAKNGLILTLRSIIKNPEPLVPNYLKSLNLENIVMDGISGQHPYASVVVSKLADAINIMHTHPKLVFLPNQLGLNNGYSSYANQLYWLEFENKGNYNWTIFKDVIKIVDTEDLQELKQDLKDSLQIDKKLLIRSRLFDLVIGDWDRHAKQWGWIVQKESNTYKAIPLPTDRDNAFFDVEGIINNLITDKSITPHLQNFENDIEYIEGQVYDFDVYFLQNKGLEDFIAEAEYIQHHLTNDAIENAFEVWNTELYNLNARELIRKIKSRRDHLKLTATKFYNALKNRPLLDKPLKGSDASDTVGTHIQCFEC